jgi:ABC-type Fe3+/spermidine/putrescine transport system ATPase subunit
MLDGDWSSDVCSSDLVTHDQEEAFALSDEIIVMNNGRIEQQSAPAEIYRRPASAYVADFIGGANLVPGKVREVSAAAAAIETPFGTYESPSVSGLKPGSDAVLCLRPELLAFSGAGGIEATVTHTVFRGAEWLVEARASGDLVLSAVVADQDPPAIGSTVRLAFEPARAWIAAIDGA